MFGGLFNTLLSESLIPFLITSIFGTLYFLKASSIWWCGPKHSHAKCSRLNELIFRENGYAMSLWICLIKVAWIQFNHLHLQGKFKLLAGNFTWSNKAKVCWQAQQCFAFTPQAKFPAHNLNFHWRWRWWDQNKANI